MPFTIRRAQEVYNFLSPKKNEYALVEVEDPLFN